ncbi:hypothetical protein AAC387_Pa08g2188 [Persea americana]
MRSSGSDSALFFFFLFVVIFHSFHLSRCYALNCTLSKCSDGGPDIQFPFRLRGQPERCGYPGFELLCKGTNTILQLPSGQNLSITDISYHASRMEIVNPYDCFEELLLRLDLTASSFGPVENQDIYDYSYGYGCYDNYTFVACSKDFAISGYAEIPCLSDNTSNDVFLVPSNLNSAALGGGSCHPNKTVLVARRSCYYDSASQPIYLHWQVDGCEECFGTCRYMNDTTNQTECFYPPPPPPPAYYGCEECFGTCRYMNDTTNQTECFYPPPPPPAYYGCEECGGTHIVKHAIIGVSVTIFFLIVVSVIAFKVYQSKRSDRKKEKENQLKVDKFLEDYKSLKPIRYSYLDIKRMTDHFKHKLGQGGYGTVFKGKLPNGTFVAVKILKKSSGSDGEEFINEVGTIGRIHHVNVVRLLGFCAERYERALIYEFMSNGSLEKFIFSLDDKNPLLGWEKLRDIAIGIAKGIEYLHQGCDQRILHFDIKPHNILLDPSFNPKISDFGHAKLYSKEQSIVSMTAAKGTMGYIAPEVFSRNFGNVSHKSDVYSFGMMLLEMWYPMDRPSMKSVVQMLEGSIENLTIPPNPFGSTSQPTPGEKIDEDLDSTKLTVISE